MKSPDVCAQPWPRLPGVATLLRGGLRAVRAAFFAGTVVTFTLAGVLDVRAQLREGDPMPVLSEFGLEGDLASAPTAGRVVLLDFWASWCAPCKASFPSLSALQREWGAQGLTVIGVSVDEKKTAYDAFVSRLKPSFVTLRDAEKRLVRVVRVPTMPTSYLIDRKGVVRLVHEGFRGETTERALRTKVRQLLDETP